MNLSAPSSNNIDESDAPKLNFAVWHSRSMKAKTYMVCDLIISHELDILGITESWLTRTYRDDPIIADFNNTLPDYDFHYVLRIGRKGGGVCVCLRKSFKARTTDRKSFESFQYIDLAITSRSLRPLRLIIIYRLQKTKKKQRIAHVFLRVFSTFYEEISTVPIYLLIAGDFNFHMGNLSINRETASFADFIDSAGLFQHVCGPTHIKATPWILYFLAQLTILFQMSLVHFTHHRTMLLFYLFCALLDQNR